MTVVSCMQASRVAKKHTYGYKTRAAGHATAKQRSEPKDKGSVKCESREMTSDMPDEREEAIL